MPAFFLLLFGYKAFFPAGSTHLISAALLAFIAINNFRASRDENAYLIDKDTR